VIVIANDLSPSDTASLSREKVLGFATDIGGSTSHTAIMAKALEIPAVVGLEKITTLVKTGDKVIVDGTKGLVVINPDDETVSRYERRKDDITHIAESLLELKDKPAITKDGQRVHILANIELPNEVESAIAHGAEGVGLYRTEFLYLNRADLPSEEEQYQCYKKVGLRIAPNPVIIRTMDLGGDKFVSQLELSQEINPFMGWRAIRFSLARPKIFKVQLRAILRASVYGSLKLMYPLISGLEELQQANKILCEVKEDLTKEGIPFNRDIEVGAMIEVPSAVVIAEFLAREVDFFSVGTNDLIQYSIAVDRVNEKIAYLYEPTHPAVLRLLKNTIDAAEKANISIGMCGEMAGDPLLAPLLLGLGLKEFSCSPLNVLEMKKIISLLNFDQCEEIAREALTLTKSKEVFNFLKNKLNEIAPDLARIITEQ
jgi:phosphotransferase system enzyme I (PtsI)